MLKKHYSSKHKNRLLPKIYSQKPICVGESALNSNNESSFETNHLNDNSELNRDNDNLIEKFLYLIVRIKENYSIADSIVNEIALEFLAIFEEVLNTEEPMNSLNEFKKYSKSTYLQNKYLENSLETVSCKEIIASGKEFHYISLKEQLTIILNEERNYELIKSERGNN
jgi:hypothetical protein